VKLVTFGEGAGRVGVLDGDEVAVLDVPTMREWFERGGADETGERVPLAETRLRAHEVTSAILDWIPTWEDDESNSYRGAKAIVNVGAVEGGFGWRVSRTPHHTDLFLDVRVPPTKAMAAARGDVLAMVRGLAERFPEYGIEGEVYVTAPGAEIEEGHELVQAIDAVHEEVFGEAPGRDVTRWFSDASALTRYGVPTVNYGTSTGLMDVELGENLDIDGLVKTVETYARVAMTICEVA
jgi:acetylornithine deacetylase/succinyl-diaminopimelate desuccinylase-like protein